jgi:ribosomal protein S3
MDNQVIIHFGRVSATKGSFNAEVSTYLSLSLWFRILVPSDAVGAIIGKQGSTIKQIKQSTHAKYGAE